MGPESINPFQAEVEKRVTMLLRDLGRPFDRRIGTSGHPSTSSPPETTVLISSQELRVWIYEDSASFLIGEKGDYYELPDYAGPGALAESLLTELRRRLEKARLEHGL
jgi:hypothetical protein